MRGQVRLRVRVTFPLRKRRSDPFLLPSDSSRARTLFVQMLLTCAISNPARCRLRWLCDPHAAPTVTNLQRCVAAAIQPRRNQRGVESAAAKLRQHRSRGEVADVAVNRQHRGAGRHAVDARQIQMPVGDVAPEALIAPQRLERRRGESKPTFIVSRKTSSSARSISRHRGDVHRSARRAPVRPRASPHSARREIRAPSNASVTDVGAYGATGTQQVCSVAA